MPAGTQPAADDDSDTAAANAAAVALLEAMRDAPAGAAASSGGGGAAWPVRCTVRVRARNPRLGETKIAHVTTLTYDVYGEVRAVCVCAPARVSPRSP